MKTLHRFPVTSFATVLATILMLASVFTHFDPFALMLELMLEVLEQIQRYKMDKLAIPVAVIMAGFLIDRMIVRPREQREAEIQIQRLRVLKATMRSVHHIVNNFLNSLQLFRLDAEDTLPLESLELLDELVRDTSAQLQTLGDLETTPEKPTPIRICIDYAAPCAAIALPARA